MKTIALANQKGGVGKTTTAASLGVGLAQQGKKVLLVDADAQGNLTQMLGWRQPDELSPTLSDLMTKTVNEEPIAPGEGILHHASGVDLVPANIELSGMEVSLVKGNTNQTLGIDPETEPVDSSGAVIYPELEYIEVCMITASTGADAEVTANPEEDTENSLPVTVSFYATQEQAVRLAELEQQGVFHIALRSSEQICHD